MYDPDPVRPTLTLTAETKPLTLPQSMVDAGIEEAYRLFGAGTVTEETFVAAVYRAMDNAKPIDFAL